MIKRDIYVENKALDEALELWQAKLDSVGFLQIQIEEIPVDAALGRITAAAVFAWRSSPFYNASAMDGIAVRFADTIGATERNPLCLKKDQFVPVNTGAAVPDNFDAVVMIEDVQPLEDGAVEIIRAVVPCSMFALLVKISSSQNWCCRKVIWSGPLTREHCWLQTFYP